MIYLPYRCSCCILLPGKRSSTSLRVHPAPGRRFSHDGVSAALLGRLDNSPVVKFARRLVEIRRFPAGSWMRFQCHVGFQGCKPG